VSRGSAGGAASGGGPSCSSAGGNLPENKENVLTPSMLC
jgi:hypothetical protein